MKIGMFYMLLLLPYPLFAQHAPIALVAVYDNGSRMIKLKWHHNNPIVYSYHLQRSEDQVHWTNGQEITVTSPEKYKFISITDKTIQSGKIFYRLKLQLNEGQTIFSKPTTVIVGTSGADWIMYPVPVGDWLNLQYNGNLLIPGVIGITIRRSNGMVFHQLRYASSARLIRIPVSNLGRGFYDLQIHIQNRLVWKKTFVK